MVGWLAVSLNHLSGGGLDSEISYKSTKGMRKRKFLIQPLRYLSI